MVRAILLIVAIVLNGAVCGARAEQAGAFSDPMRPAAEPSREAKRETAGDPLPRVDTSHWRLSAVLQSPTRAVALINGTPMAIGDTVAGYRLIDIAADRVTLKRGRDKIVLTRDGAGLKKKSATEGSRK